MPVNLIAPSSTSFSGDSVSFVWTSSDGSYCYDNFLNISDSSGALVASSGTFNPNGDISLFFASGLTGLGTLDVEVSCNPNNVGSFQFIESTSTTPTDPNNPNPSGPVTGEVVLVIPEGGLPIDDGISTELREVLIEFAFGSFALALSVAFLTKLLR